MMCRFSINAAIFIIMPKPEANSEKEEYFDAAMAGQVFGAEYSDKIYLDGFSGRLKKSPVGQGS